jgi:predicted transcriptional regulator
MDIKASLDRVLTWPPERQQDVVRILDDMERMDRSPLYLDEQQLAGIDEALAAGDRGEFVSEAEIAALWRRWGV